MEPLYCLRVALSIAAMYLAYKIFLSRDNFHALNRIAILASVAVSFVLPLMKLPAFFAANTDSTIPAAMIEFGEIVATVAEEKHTSFADCLPYLLLAGAAVFFLRFLISTVSIAVKTVNNKKITLKKGTKLILLETIQSPVSWLKYIFMSRNDYEENPEEILAHEMAHISYRHSIDLIFMDLACCMQWFNPAVWLFRRELCAVHEFQADKAVIEAGFNAKQYQILLIKKAAGRKWSSVANSLNHSNLKKRITMMSIQKKSTAAAFKALLPMAVAAICAVTFADCNSEKEVLSPENNPSLSTLRVSDSSNGRDTTIALGDNVIYVVDGGKVDNIKHIATDMVASIEVFKGPAASKWTSDPDGSVMLITTKKSAKNDEVFMVVEDMPEFPGGDVALRQFIAENVRYPEEAKKQNLSGTVYIKFIVTETGKVSEPTLLKGTESQEINNEALRVVELLPDFKPGKQRGQAVPVSLVVPIKFALAE